MEVATQSETSTIGRVQVNWADDLVKGDLKRFEPPKIKKQPQGYIGYMEFMAKVVDSQRMVGKSRYEGSTEECKEFLNFRGNSCSSRELGSVEDRSRWTRFFQEHLPH